MEVNKRNIKLGYINIPDDPEIRIWRYIDFTKFVSILDSNSLYFSRMDLLGDKFEGSYPKTLIETRKYMLKDGVENIKTVFNSTDIKTALNSQDVASVLDSPVFGLDGEKKTFIDYFSDSTSNIIELSRKWTYVNCWHMNEHESAALWKIYSSSYDAIAIQSRYKLLKENMPTQAIIGKVTYIDYNNIKEIDYKYFRPSYFKRLSFSHERELRVTITEYPPDYSIRKDNVLLGKYIPVNINNLIENIYVAPSSPDWFKQVVENVMRKYGLEKDLLKSSLDDVPLF